MAKRGKKRKSKSAMASERSRQKASLNKGTAPTGGPSAGAGGDTNPAGGPGTPPPQSTPPAGNPNNSSKSGAKTKPKVVPTEEERKRLSSAIEMMKQWIIVHTDSTYDFVVKTVLGVISYSMILFYSIASALESLRPELLDDIKSCTEDLVKDLRFIDDGFFRVAMNGKLKLIQDLLRDITGDYTLTLKSMQLQYDFSFPGLYHNFVVDAFCVTTKDELIILEVQKKERGEDYPRSLAEGHGISFSSLPAGEPYKNLKPLYVVYLTDVDVFGSGELLHKDEMAQFPPGIKSDVPPLFKTFYLNCAYVEDGDKKKEELQRLKQQVETETEALHKGWLKWRINQLEAFLEPGSSA